jgi:hypothetical protein
MANAKIDNSVTRRFLEQHNRLFPDQPITLEYESALEAEPETYVSPPESPLERLKPSEPPPVRYLPPQLDLEAWRKHAQQAAKPLEDDLTDAHHGVYLALNTVALALWGQRGYSDRLSVVNFFMPAELIYNWFGIPKRTFYAALERLEAMNLIKRVGHNCKAAWWSPKGDTWCDGTVWAVKVNPLSDERPKVPHDWLKKQYRNLNTDIREGRTVWALLQRVKESLHSQRDGLKALLKFNELLLWSETPHILAPHQESMTVQSSRELFDRLNSLGTREVPPKNSEIAEIAYSMAFHMHDGDKQMYLKLLWNACRMDKRGVPDGLRAIVDALKRVLDNPDWSKIKSGGALFVTRLKETGHYDDIRREPPTRIGVKP